MFTGLVQAKGRLTRLDRVERGVEIEIDPCGWAHGVGEGGSIAVNGCCLTVDSDPGAIGGRLRFFAIPETLAKTNLKRLGVGDEVNLEASVTAQTLLGGHFVQGHVDGVGEVIRIDTPEASGGEWRVRVRPPAGLMKFMSPKGSVCLDGVSLTIAALEAGDRAGGGGWIEAALIPVTLEKTILASYRVGDGVNIEADILAKTLVHYLEHYAPASGGV